MGVGREARSLTRGRGAESIIWGRAHPACILALTGESIWMAQVLLGLFLFLLLLLSSIIVGTNLPTPPL